MVETMRKRFMAIIIAIFLITSIIVMMPHSEQEKQQIRAKSLNKKVTIKRNTERIDFVDENGEITFAADSGYATVVITNNNTSKLEQYYDDKGMAVIIYPGYSALLKEYDNEGRNYHTTYIGADGQPVVISFGYSDKIQQYYDDGRIKSEKYYDPKGNIVCTKAYGAGLMNEYYNNGKTIKTIFLNEKEEPTEIDLGYAILIRNIYITDGPERGKVESEFYYNVQNEPIALSLGQYGVHKEYDENGLESVLVYLDAEGNPIITNKGYTKVKKTYYPNNYTASERYYDINGQPFSLPEGQYGIKKSNDQIIYLDRNGNEAFNIKRFLYNQTWVIVPCALTFILLLVFIKKCRVLFLALYGLVIIYLTLMFRENEEKMIFEMFSSYRRFFVDYDVRVDIFRNIWLFIPLGALLYHIHPKKTVLLIPVVLSFLIEGIQYIARIGFFEFDDILNNSVGGWIGFYSGQLTTSIISRMNKWKPNDSV